MWGLILIQSHEKNTCMTASFHKERRFGLWNLPLFIEVPVPSQKSGKLHICARSVDLSPFRPTVLCFFIFHLSYVHIPDMTISTGFDINLYFTLFRWRGITLNEHTFGFYGHIDKYNVCLAHICNFPLFWLGTGTSMKSGRFHNPNLLSLWNEAVMQVFFSCDWININPHI
jgi:hypothetical protein